MFRGVTIAAMLLVNNPGDWAHVYGPLRHAEWHGCTPTDLIFPFFLFIVGAAMAFSLRRWTDADGPPGGAFWWRLTRRVVLLLGLGLLLNGFPSFDLASLRLPGVLQRIGLVYAITAVLVVLLRSRWLVAVATGLLIGYWLVLTQWPVDGVAPALEPDRNLPRTIDLAVFGAPHLWSGSPTDPEGLLSTLPATVTCLLGFAAGVWVRDRGPRGVQRLLLLWGVLLAAAGWAWSLVLPLNKPLWTSSFVLWTGGLGMLAFAACSWVVDVRGVRAPLRAFERMGVNAITAFVGSGLLARLLVRVPMGDGSLKQACYDAILGLGLAPVNASLAFAVLTVALWMAILWAMERLGVRLRV